MESGAKTQINVSQPIPTIVTPNVSSSSTNQPLSNFHVKTEEKIAGSYKIEKTIGKGNYAVVKLAHHVFTGQKVAIKIIDKTKLDLMSKIQLFQEVNCMKLVRHPNVVKLYEVIDTPNKLYLILELGEGGDLYDYILKYDKGIIEKKAKEYFRQLLNAIIYCHKMHVVHRDLKPENVIFFDNYDTVKLTDFGFSNKFKPGQKLETSCGSLAYSAPEILLGDQYDAQAIDIWSLGVLLYMLVVGKCPFLETNDNETITMIIDCKYTIPPHISAECKDLIGKMLVKDPAKRAKLEEILNHPWLRSHQTNATTTNSSSNSSAASANASASHNLGIAFFSRADITDDIHKAIINKMVSGGIATEHQIKQSLKRDCYNHVTATYYLLAEKILKYKSQNSASLMTSSATTGGSHTLKNTNNNNNNHMVQTSGTINNNNNNNNNNNSNTTTQALSNHINIKNSNGAAATLKNSPTSTAEDTFQNIQLLKIDGTPDTLGLTVGYEDGLISSTNINNNNNHNHNNTNKPFMANGDLRGDKALPRLLGNIKNNANNLSVPNGPPVNNNISSSSLPELMSTSPTNFYAQDLMYSPPPATIHEGATLDVTDQGLSPLLGGKGYLTRKSYDGTYMSTLNPSPMHQIDSGLGGAFFVTHRSSSPIVGPPPGVITTNLDSAALSTPPSPLHVGPSTPPPLRIGAINNLSSGGQIPPKSPTLSLGAPASYLGGSSQSLNNYSAVRPQPLHRFSAGPTSGSILKLARGYKHNSVDNLSNLTNFNQYIHPKHQTPHQYFYNKLLSEEKYPPPLITSTIIKLSQPPYGLLNDNKQRIIDKSVPKTPRDTSLPSPTTSITDASASSLTRSASNSSNGSISSGTSSYKSALSNNLDSIPRAGDQLSITPSGLANGPNYEHRTDLTGDQAKCSSNRLIHLNFSGGGSMGKKMLSAAAIPSKICEEAEPPPEEESSYPISGPMSAGGMYRSRDRYRTPYYDQYTRGTDLSNTIIQPHHRANSLTEQTIDQLLNDRLARIRLFSSVTSRSSPSFPSTPLNLADNKTQMETTPSTLAQSPLVTLANNPQGHKLPPKEISPLVGDLPNNSSAGTISTSISTQPTFTIRKYNVQQPLSFSSSSVFGGDTISANTTQYSIPSNNFSLLNSITGTTGLPTIDENVFPNSSINSASNQQSTNTIDSNPVFAVGGPLKKQLPFTSLEEISEEDET